MSEGLDLRTLRTLLVACSLGAATLATTGLIVSSEARVPTAAAAAAACVAHESSVKDILALGGELYASASQLAPRGARREVGSDASVCARASR